MEHRNAVHVSLNDIFHATFSIFKDGPVKPKNDPESSAARFFVSLWVCSIKVIYELHTALRLEKVVFNVSFSHQFHHSCNNASFWEVRESLLQ